MRRTVLFVTHHKKKCGVYEFGRNVFHAIASSKEYNFIKAECDSIDELLESIDSHQPFVIIYNYTPSVMPWLCTKISPKLYVSDIRGIKAIQIGIIHDVTQDVANKATAYRKKFLFGGIHKFAHILFDYYIAPDPTLLLRNPIVFKTGRLVPSYKNHYTIPLIPVIGSFGFGTPGKGFEKIVQKVQEEFDEAIIKLNIPSADFGDATGENARRIAANCKALVAKPNIRLEITHDFLDDTALLDFLAQNSINVFMYADQGGRGLSSAIDNALAVQRPIGVSGSSMFRHILQTQPSICLDNSSIKEIMANGFEPLKKYSSEWNSLNLAWEYGRTLNAIIKSKESGHKTKIGALRTVLSVWRIFFSLPDKSFTWLRDTDSLTEDNLQVLNSIDYKPITLTKNNRFNRILDNEARDLYKSAEETIFQLVPKTIAKKIPAANVQQAFVFDTVLRFTEQYHSPRLLCIGSYEDTASMSLIKMGWKVDEIDPIINYALQEYCTKPSVQRESYDIIFSTSVIEHDPDDETFINCLERLLAPAGIAILTCDYNDQWKPGDPKPEVDARFYTKKDLGERLLKLIPSCVLIDEPQWDCPNPDFSLMGKYQYTFATFVVKKRS